MKKSIFSLSLLISVGSVGAASAAADEISQLSGLAFLQQREAGLSRFTIECTPVTDQTNKDTDTDCRPPQSPAKNIEPQTMRKGNSFFEYEIISYGNPSDPQGQFNPFDPYNHIPEALKNQENKPTSCYATPCGSTSNSGRTSPTGEANPDDCMFDMDEEQSNN